jgi:hypothetical protein
MTSVVYTMIARGKSSELIQKIYTLYKSEPFTYKGIRKKIPHIRASLITAMHNSNVIKLTNGNKRVSGITKKTPSVWVFTSEALLLLQKYYRE